MKLNRELTEKLFNCTTVEDLTNVVNEAETLGIDLNTASRISIDEVLNKFYHKRCTGIKEHAVKMLIGAVRGEDIPDIPTTPSLKAPNPVPFEKYAQVAMITPEERANKICERVSTLVDEAPDNFIMFSNLRKDPEIKSLSVSEEDMQKLFVTHSSVVVGLNSRKKMYAMRRDPEVMQALSSKWGDTYFE